MVSAIFDFWMYRFVFGMHNRVDRIAGFDDSLGMVRIGVSRRFEVGHVSQETVWVRGRGCSKVRGRVWKVRCRGGVDDLMVDLDGFFVVQVVVADFDGFAIEVEVDVVVVEGRFAVDVEPPVADSRRLVEDCSVGAEEAVVTAVWLAVVPHLWKKQ